MRSDLVQPPSPQLLLRDPMKSILAIFGIQAANKAASDETSQLAVLSFVGLILFVFVAAFFTNLILKRRKESRAKFKPQL